MSKKLKNSGGFSRLWFFLFLLLIGGFFLAIAIPNFTGSRVSKLNKIFNNLRYIDGAKQGWALERGITNADQAAHFSRLLSWKDLTPYLLQDINVIQSKCFDSNGVTHPVSGEIYMINPLGKSPEAKLVQKIDMPWPKGSIIRFSVNPKPNAYLEITFPDGTTTNY
jgi:hypothetical protein